MARIALETRATAVGLRRRGIGVASRTREFAGGYVHLVHAVPDAPLGESSRRRLERARFHDIAADAEKRLVDPADHIGPREDQMVVAAFERFSPEIGSREMVALDVRPHRAVVDEDSIGQRVQIVTCG